MTKKERLEAIIDYYSDGKPSVFAKYIGVAPSTISSWLSRDTLDYDLIFAKCENISSNWLLTGKGEMIKNAEREQKTIEISESAISKTKRKGALIYDIDATCGLSGRDIEFTDEKVIGSIDAPEINSDSKIIFATGDSMLPLIASGDRVVIRKIESWDYFNYGQVYLIITNEYRLIKRVRRHPKDADNLILLRSENPDYDDIDLPKREIIHLFIVENILSIKNIL